MGLCSEPGFKMTLKRGFKKAIVKIVSNDNGGSIIDQVLVR